MAKKKEEAPEMRYLVRIANTDLDGRKHVLFALTKIKGVGESFARSILAKAGVDPTKKAGFLTDDEVKKLETLVTKPLESGIPAWATNRQRDYETGEDQHLINADLTFTKENDIKRLMRIKSNRGLRHAWRLPLRGQRTKSNFRRSKSKAASSGKTRKPSRGGQ
jgi:small subunit ribosomal protein S13